MKYSKVNDEGETNRIKAIVEAFRTEYYRLNSIESNYEIINQSTEIV